MQKVGWGQRKIRILILMGSIEKVVRKGDISFYTFMFSNFLVVIPLCKIVLDVVAW